MRLCDRVGFFQGMLRGVPNMFWLIYPKHLTVFYNRLFFFLFVRLIVSGFYFHQAFSALMDLNHYLLFLFFPSMG